MPVAVEKCVRVRTCVCVRARSCVCTYSVMCIWYVYVRSYGHLWSTFHTYFTDSQQEFSILENVPNIIVRPAAMDS